MSAQCFLFNFFHFTHLIDVPAIFWERNSISSLNNNSSNWDNNYIWHPQQNCDIYLEHMNMVFHFNLPFEVLIKAGTQQKHYLRTQGHLDIWSLLRGSWHKNFTDPNCLLQSTKLNLKLKFENLFHFLKILSHVVGHICLLWCLRAIFMMSFSGTYFRALLQWHINWLLSEFYSKKSTHKENVRKTKSSFSRF